jgi:hypothetical protein
MMDRRLYEIIFQDDDAININNEWHIENGLHRALTLKCLGRDYVAKTDPSWIKVKLEMD